MGRRDSPRVDSESRSDRRSLQTFSFYQIVSFGFELKIVPLPRLRNCFMAQDMDCPPLAQDMSPATMLRSILSIARDDDDDCLGESRSHFDESQRVYYENSWTGEVLADITFLRKEISNAREDILIDKLEVLQKRNEELSENLEEAVNVIRYLNQKLEAQKMQQNKDLTDLLHSNQSFGQIDDDDDASLALTTHRTKVHSGSLQGSECGSEIQVENLDPDVVDADGRVCQINSPCLNPESSFKWTKDEKILFLLKVPLALL